MNASRELEARVVVALNSDESVRQLKGPGRPIQDDLARASILAAFPEVRDVIVFSEETPFQLIQLVKPSCIVKGGQYDGQAVVGSDVAPVKFFPMVEGVSTTEIVERCRRS